MGKKLPWSETFSAPESLKIVYKWIPVTTTHTMTIIKNNLKNHYNGWLGQVYKWHIDSQVKIIPLLWKHRTFQMSEIITVEKCQDTEINSSSRHWDQFKTILKQAFCFISCTPSLTYLLPSIIVVARMWNNEIQGRLHLFCLSFILANLIQNVCVWFFFLSL